MTLWLGDIISINATTARNKHSLGIHGLDSSYLHMGINHGFSYVERRRIIRTGLASFLMLRSPHAFKLRAYQMGSQQNTS